MRGGALPRACGGRPTASPRPQRDDRPAVPAMPSGRTGRCTHLSHPRTPSKRYLQPVHNKAPGNKEPFAHRNRGPTGSGGASASKRDQNLQNLEPTRDSPQRRPRGARRHNAAARQPPATRIMPGLPGQAPPAEGAAATCPATTAHTARKHGLLAARATGFLLGCEQLPVPQALLPAGGRGQRLRRQQRDTAP